MSIFIKNLMNTDIVKRDSMHWKVVNGQYYFVLKTFSKSDSEKIKSGIVNEPTKFIFDNNGNLIYGGVKYINPMVTNKSGEYDNTMTLERIKTLGGYIYKFGINMIASYNLKFLLHFGEDKVYILYNPLHRNYFKKYYDSVADKTGLNGRTNTGKYPLDKLFRSYCSSMKDTNGVFVDPTCLCIESPLTCQQDAVFKINVANYPPLTDSTKKKISAIGNCCTSLSPGCLYGTNLEEEDSFINAFQATIQKANSGCPRSIEFNDCSILVDVAGDAKFDASGFVNQCGGTKLVDDTNDEDLIIDPAKGTVSIDGSLPGSTIQGWVETEDETLISGDLPPVGTETINPTLSDQSDLVLRPEDVVSNEKPYTLQPTSGSLSDSLNQNDPILVPSIYVDEQAETDREASGVLDQLSEDTESNENPLVSFFNKNKILSISLIAGFVFLLLILIIFLFLAR